MGKRKTKVEVLNREWSVVVKSDKEHQRSFQNCHAIALLYERIIYVRKSSVNEETIRHELAHAYTHELSFVELQLDDDQVEEFFCELIAKYSDKITSDAKLIVHTLGGNA